MFDGVKNATILYPNLKEYSPPKKDIDENSVQESEEHTKVYILYGTDDDIPTDLDSLDFGDYCTYCGPVISTRIEDIKRKIDENNNENYFIICDNKIYPVVKDPRCPGLF